MTILEREIGGIKRQTVDSGRKVLIVEDDASNRLFLKVYMKSLNFQVREADNGARAIDIYREWLPDLVWLDIKLPIYNGHEVARNIRIMEVATKKVEPAKIIAMTAGLEIDREYIKAVGHDDIIYKPIYLSTIDLILKQYLGVEKTA